MECFTQCQCTSLGSSDEQILERIWSGEREKLSTSILLWPVQNQIWKLKVQDWKLQTMFLVSESEGNKCSKWMGVEEVRRKMEQESTRPCSSLKENQASIRQGSSDDTDYVRIVPVLLPPPSSPIPATPPLNQATVYVSKSSHQLVYPSLCLPSMDRNADVFKGTGNHTHLWNHIYYSPFNNSSHTSSQAWLRVYLQAQSPLGRRNGIIESIDYTM